MMFKSGDRVRMKYFDRYAYGSITIAQENESKIMFDGDFDLPYGYYPNEELELSFSGEGVNDGTPKTDMQNR